MTKIDFKHLKIDPTKPAHWKKLTDELKAGWQIDWTQEINDILYLILAKDMN